MTDDQMLTYLDAAATIMGVPIPPDHRAGVLGFFRLSADLAASLEAFDLPAHEEPAPVFRPGRP